jgi:hypothetical protein
MTVHLSARAPSTSGTRYLADLFLHVRSCSRRVTESMRRTEELEQRLRDGLALRPPQISDAAAYHENVVADVLAAVAVAAVEQLRRLEEIAPGFEIDDMTNLSPKPVDVLVRPVFEASGILDDFMPWDERFPDHDDPEIPD